MGVEMIAPHKTDHCERHTRCATASSLQTAMAYRTTLRVAAMLRRLVTRFETKAKNFLAFIQLRCVADFATWGGYECAL